MATLTILTTAEQDAALEALVAKVNTARAAEDPPKAPVTVEQYVRFVMGKLFDSYVERQAVDERDSIKAAWQDATPEVKAQIKDLLGVE